MATHDYVIDNSTGANVRADLNLVLQAILTNNSSSSAPSTTAAYMWWADTTNGILKIRNSADNAWVELLQLDGTLTLEDGSASTPALAFRDDLNTGIFSSAADTFNISTGGTERLQLTDTEACFNDGGADVDFRVEGDTKTHLLFCEAGTDRVGIGTDSPTSLLHVDTGTTTTTALQLSNDDNSAYSSAAEGHINTVLSLQSTTTAGQNDQSVGIQFSLALSGQTGSIQEIAAVRTGSGEGALIFRTRNSSVGRIERFRIHSDGDCEIKDGDLVIGTSGHGIDFSADGSASGMESELLNDYEEGVFTPTNTIGSTLSENHPSRYVKVGNLCYIMMDVSFSGASDSSQTGIIQSLPFTSQTLTNGVQAVSYPFISETSSTARDADESNTAFFIGSNESRVDIYNLAGGYVQTRAFTTGRRFRMNFCYRTA
mgnify:CR=1 FL=1|tara:strand:+ start:104 stop:1390 length:1287 start_codon:yes stop_codon:yes gene_type:complete